MLHLTHHAPKGWNVTPEYPVLVHTPQFADDAFRAAQETQKHFAVGRITTEGRIDPVAGTPHGTQGLRRHTFELRVQLQQMEGFEDGARGALE